MKKTYEKLLFLILLLPVCVLAQHTTSGLVLDKTSGQPIPGVNVNVLGGTNGSATDLDGKFVLSNVKQGDKIVFSFIGYKSETVEFKNQKSLTVALVEDVNQLDVVVVQVGYGTVRKKDATGAVTLITTKDFNKGATVTAENLLNGRVAGLTVITSGAPGSGSQIRIRGGSSLFASNDPLIVIDGLPISNSSNTGSTSFLASLNPNDIESFSVLKDASATAIYGSRASNGVIIITTKKGGKRLSVDFNFQYGSGNLTNKVDVFSADDYRALIATRLPDQVVNLGTVNTDWQDAIYRRTDYIDNNVSIKGNLFNAIPSRLSFGNTFQEGLRLTNNFNRNTFSASLSPSLFKDHLKFRVNANYANEKNRFAGGVEGSAISFDPTQPIYKEGSPYGGYFEYYTPSATNPLVLGPRNPVAQLMQTNDTGVNNRIFGNVEMDYKFHFLPELRVVANVGYDESKGNRTNLVSSNAASSPSNNNIPFGTDEYSERTIKNKLFDGYLSYNKKIETLNFDATAGYSYQKFEGQSYYTRNQLDPKTIGPETDIDTDIVLVGFFARTNLNFDDKYLLTLSYRRDGSSRFSEDNRWGNFPAAAFAWKLKEEFFKDSKVVSDFKLRLGYGITGQQDIGSSASTEFLQKYVIGNGNSQYTFGTTPLPIGVSSVYNTNLKWEETTTYNVGIDYGIYDNRISGSIEFFYKDSKDLLVRAAVPDGSNFSNRGWQNIGNMTTKGLELTINAEIFRTKDFNWNVNFNATKFERRIDKLALKSDILLGGTGAGTGGTVQIFREGYTPYSFYVRKQLFDDAGKPIEGSYADLNGDGVLNDNDRYIYKNPDPDATFGFASNLNYKNFDFSFNLRANVGNSIYNAVNAGRAQYANLLNGVVRNIPTQVTETNFITTSNVVLSDVYIENASFLKLDNVTLGYTFPNWLEGKASLRLFAGVQNAFVITKYSGLDPEITNNGIDNTIYPRQRSVLFGANIKF
jgi:iron complex outermembrane receptor protein